MYKVTLTKQLLPLLILDWYDVEIKAVFNTENFFNSKLATILKIIIIVIAFLLHWLFTSNS